MGFGHGRRCVSAKLSYLVAALPSAMLRKYARERIFRQTLYRPKVCFRALSRGVSAIRQSKVQVAPAARRLAASASLTVTVTSSPRGLNSMVPFSSRGSSKCPSSPCSERNRSFHSILPDFVPETITPADLAEPGMRNERPFRHPIRFCRCRGCNAWFPSCKEGAAAVVFGLTWRLARYNTTYLA